MKIRLINAADVRALLPMDACIGLMRQAMRLVAEGRTIQPIRSGLQHPSGHGLIGMMPGYMGEPEWLGIKVVTVFPGNFGGEHGGHQGFVLLFEPQNGTPRAVLDGQEITAIRTAATTAVATDALARADARTLFIFGYGRQAEQHISALPLVRPFDRISLWGRDFAKAQAFCEAKANEHGWNITPVASAEQAAVEADVICTLTAAPEPIFKAEWLRPGQHLNVVGSSIPTTSEIDIETVARSRFFVDLKDSVLALAGDFRRAREAGAVTDSHIIGSIGDVITGRVQGRISDSDVTLFKSLGMIVEDLVAANFILTEAERLNVGQLVDW